MIKLSSLERTSTVSDIPNLSLHQFIASVDDIDMSLETLCKKIKSLRLLQCGLIVAAESYVVQSWVRHRYVILELELPGNERGPSTAWIRLDRQRPAQSIVTFISASSTSTAHDRVYATSFLPLSNPNPDTTGSYVSR